MRIVANGAAESLSLLGTLARSVLADQRPLTPGDLKRMLFAAAAGVGAKAIFKSYAHHAAEVRALVEVILGEDGEGGVF